MHKLYRTPKERLARPLWALNNPIDLKADIRSVRLVRKQKAPNYSENDSAYSSRNVQRGPYEENTNMALHKENVALQSKNDLARFGGFLMKGYVTYVLKVYIIFPIGPA